MATHRSAPVVPLVETAAAMLTRPETAARAQVIANRVCELLPDSAAVVYVIEDPNYPAWTAKATAGEINVVEVADFEVGTLGAIATGRTVQTFDFATLNREDFSHLDIRRNAVSLAYLPLISEGVLVGAVEVIAYEQSLSAAALQCLGELTELASPAMAGALNYERERNISLQSISRVTQMYDLEKVFNSTLELDELLPMVAKKFADVMNVQGVNLWMVNGDDLELVYQAGFDATVTVGSVQRVGEGVAAEVSESGEAVLIDDPDDERLRKRSAGHEEAEVFSLLVAPLMELQSLVGVVEAINRQDGLPFDEDDHFLLINMCETASNALHNAELLQAERKLEVLEALVRVSGEITSTLDLDRVLQAVVNEPCSCPHAHGSASANTGSGNSGRVHPRWPLRSSRSPNTANLRRTHGSVARRCESAIRRHAASAESCLGNAHHSVAEDGVRSENRSTTLRLEKLGQGRSRVSTVCGAGRRPGPGCPMRPA